MKLSPTTILVLVIGLIAVVGVVLFIVLSNTTSKGTITTPRYTTRKTKEMFNSGNPGDPQIRFYNNGTLITSFNIQNSTTGNILQQGHGYAAGAASQWFSVPAGTSLYGSVGSNASAQCDISNLQAGHNYELRQNCWWPAQQCCSFVQTS